MFLQDEGTQMPADDTMQAAGGDDMNTGNDQAAESGMENAGGEQGGDQQ